LSCYKLLKNILTAGMPAGTLFKVNYCLFLLHVLLRFSPKRDAHSTRFVFCVNTFLKVFSKSACLENYTSNWLLPSRNVGRILHEDIAPSTPFLSFYGVFILY